ncbi:MAG: aminoacetone oxidase family FAD-binding enzyme [Planctomycetota bacterium]
MSDGSSPVDVAVIGGGAAGLMAALFAARRGSRVALLEGSRQCGLKILVSGGGRCNVLPSEFDHRDFYTSGSRNVLKRLFRTWPLDDVTAFFQNDLGVPLTIEPETGKVFPRSQKSKEVRDALVRAVEQAGAEIRCEWRVAGVELDSSGEGVRIRSEHGAALRAKRWILATGGRSLPKTGSDGFGYGLAEQFGHSCVPTYPALVPLATGDEAIRALTGIAIPIRWRAVSGKKTLEDRTRELLFTHRGFSGPAILDASHWSVRDAVPILIGWGAIEREEWERALTGNPKRDTRSVVGERLPRRLAELLCERAKVPDPCTLAHLPKRAKDQLLTHLCDYPLPASGNLGYRVAEVTGGGVPLGEVNPSTLESRSAPSLHLCGEILDVIGRIGGYNFLWAWVTGRIAGESAAGTG